MTARERAEEFVNARHRIHHTETDAIVEMIEAAEKDAREAGAAEVDEGAIRDKVAAELEALDQEQITIRRAARIIRGTDDQED